MTGLVAKLNAVRMFGFITTTDDQPQQFFFHRSGCRPPDSFLDLREGDRVEFVEVPSEKGPRAGRVLKVSA